MLAPIAAATVAIMAVQLLIVIPQSFGDAARLQVSEIRIFKYDKNDISDYHFNGTLLSTVQEGTEIIVNGMVKNQNHTGEHFDYITAIFDNDGYARYIHVREGVAVPLGGQIGIDSETLPIILDAGNYSIRVFTWRNAGDNVPVALSDGATMPITVAHADGFAWLAMNTTQCSNPWDMEYMNEYRSNPSVAEELQGEEPVVQWYFESRGIEILDIESVGYLPDNVAVCEACNCTSGETLYVKVASDNVEEMKDVGFVEKEPPFEA